MPRFAPTHLDDQDRALLRALARLRFATADQLTAWCTLQRAAVSKRLHALEQGRFVDVAREGVPHVFRLLSRGYAGADARPPAGSRHYSWSVMAHRCHRNALELATRKRIPGFTFQPRIYNLKRGLFPGHGEHSALDDKGTRYFCLLDDYLMPSTRIRHAWTRLHKADPRHWPSARKPQRWRDNADRYLVAATDETQLERHRRAAERHGLAVEFLSFAPLWRGA